MKALVCEKGTFTKSTENGEETSYYLNLAKKNKDGVVQICKKNDHKSLKYYFVTKAVYDKVLAGFVYDFEITVDQYSERITIGDKVELSKF